MIVLNKDHPFVSISVYKLLKDMLAALDLAAQNYSTPS